MGVPISNVTRRVVLAASGTGPYNFTFEILAASDIAVYRDDTLLTLTTNYTVTINSNGTGFVTLTATPTGATQIAIVGNRTIQRTTDFVTGGDFFANTVNNEMDQQTIFAQQNAEAVDRALKAPQTDPTTIDMTLPKAADRANKTLAFDANGDPTLGISAADVANAVTYATNAANSATAAASSASSASSSASSASSSASTASTQASNASTSATNASNSASSASTSATNAASSASTASTQASNASTSATNAASSASAASTSAANAATSATNASNSASTATTQASNAASSASSASGSATSAANSAAAAASALDSFDDRYLGTKASDPTLDNDGNALVAGALYFSTTQNVMKVYDGASWITATSAGATSLLQFKYVATAGQTTFSGAAAVGGTLTYTVNNIVVFLNGVALDSTDYTASTGSSVVLGTAAALNDELVIIAFKSFTVADTYTKGETDGFLANKQAADAELTTLAGMGASRATYLASNEGFGFRNRILNGGMVIDQRNAGASVTLGSGTVYTLDRFAVQSGSGSKLSAQQNAGSVTPPAGFRNYLGLTSLSAYSVPAGEIFALRQYIEGFNVADLGWGAAGAQSVTLSFWVRSSLTGTFGGSVNNNSNRSYPFTYTISAANTWELETITIPGDTSGTWATGNTTGLLLELGLGVGSTFSGTAGAWTGSYFSSATGATSVVGTNGATFYITGVQLEAGTVASPFERRDYGRELMMCQRYFCKSFATETAPAQNAGLLGSVYFAQPTSASTAQTVTGVRFPVTMRDAPATVTIFNPSATNGQIRAVTGADWSSTTLASATGQNGFGLFSTSPGGVGAGAAAAYHYTASAEL